MLSLQSGRWWELQHAYGNAADIPALLEQLHKMPNSENEAEPWFSLWSALAHQGDVYSASFAAVPHVIAVFATAPVAADESYLQFPAWVEICRAKKLVEIPDDLKAAYFDLLSLLPGLVAQAAARHWEPSYLACALSAIAAAKGQHTIAEAILQMSSPEVAQEFLEWHCDQ
jgi:hypothetical protein